MSYNAQSELVSRLRSSVLALTEDQYAELTNSEKRNIASFERFAPHYEHRIAWALSGDTYIRGLQTHLAQHGVEFARMPFQSINTVIYLFKDVAGVQAFLDFHKTTH